MGRVSTTAGRLGVHHTSGKLEGGPEVQTRVIRRADALVLADEPISGTRRGGVEPLQELTY